MIGVGRGLLRLRESAAGMVADGYELLARRPFPRLRPRPLWYEKPLYYKGNPATFIGDGDTVRWPAYAQALDYELEIGVVIARDCSDLTREEALGVAGGFVLLNDFSARDVQFREMVEGLMGPAKSKDFGTALGSVVVTASEFLPVLDTLRVEVHVNGERWGAGSTGGMQHSVADVIAYASAGEQLEAGTVIGLGTVPGCSGIETGRWLSPGDVVELSAGPLGRLRNTVGEPEPWRQAGPVTRARWSIVIRAGEQADPQANPAPWTPPRAPALTGVLAPNQVLDQVERWEVPGGSRPEDVVFDAAAGCTRASRTAGSGGGPPPTPTPARPSCSPTPTAVRSAWRSTRVTEPSSCATRTAGCSGQTRPVIPGCWPTPTTAASSSSPTTPPWPPTARSTSPTPRPGSASSTTSRTCSSTGPTAVSSATVRPPPVSNSSRTACTSRTGWPSPRTSRSCSSRRPPRTTSCASRSPAPPRACRAVRLQPAGPARQHVPAGDGSYWVAFPSPRLPFVDRMMPHPVPRRVAARLPERLQPAAQRYGLVTRVGADGAILQSLHGPAGTYREIVGVRQHDGWLYLGSLYETAVGRVRITV